MTQKNNISVLLKAYGVIGTIEKLKDVWAENKAYDEKTLFQLEAFKIRSGRQWEVIMYSQKANHGKKRRVVLGNAIFALDMLEKNRDILCERARTKLDELREKLNNLDGSIRARTIEHGIQRNKEQRMKEFIVQQHQILDEVYQEKMRNLVRFRLRNGVLYIQTYIGNTEIKSGSMVALGLPEIYENLLRENLDKIPEYGREDLKQIYGWN